MFTCTIEEVLEEVPSRPNSVVLDEEQSSLVTSRQSGNTPSPAMHQGPKGQKRIRASLIVTVCKEQGAFSSLGMIRTVR